LLRAPLDANSILQVNWVYLKTLDIFKLVKLQDYLTDFSLSQTQMGPQKSNLMTMMLSEGAGDFSISLSKIYD